ncbi:MAG: hypothetical protein M1608_17825 [Candidatus Omnitrophica bacterium]|nr:hypothetical protein [Candidatus Omnitrophota bacterium]
MKRNLLLLLAALVVGTTTGPLAPLAQAQRGRCGVTLDSIAQTALTEALAGPEGEYAARAEYVAVVGKFGEVQPYANILLAEQQHVAALQQQCVKYGVPIPPDEYLGLVQAPDSLLDAALAGVAAEEANIAMYNELLPLVQNYSSLVQVFTNLRDASLYNHLPALEAAAINSSTVTVSADTTTATVSASGNGTGDQDRLQQKLRDGTCRTQ